MGRWYTIFADSMSSKRSYGDWVSRSSAGAGFSHFIPSALITGFDKLTRMQESPQANYYASLAGAAMTTDIIFLIGFRMVDLHINARLAEAHRRRRCPPLIFVDFWEHSFPRHERENIGRKELDMFHDLQMFTVDADFYDNSTAVPCAWTFANDRSWAI